MLLKELLEKAEIEHRLTPEQLSANITDITDDSRRIERGSVFVAVTGDKYDGHMFLSDVAEKGAAALIVEKDIPPYKDTPVIKVDNSRKALAILAHAFLNFPSNDITTVAYTGTNGKTTGTYLVEKILLAAYKKDIGRFGTIEYKIGDEILGREGNTTPSPVMLAQFFKKMNERGIRHAVMEVSSHALDQYRNYGIKFKVGVFTNLTQDHLDYHKNFENYKEAKWKLFRDYIYPNPDGIAIFNHDDETGRLFSSEYKGRKISYGINNQADCMAKNWEFTPEYSKFTICHGGKEIEIKPNLTGMFNISNILGAYSVGLALNIDPETIKTGIENLDVVPGRFESVRAGQPFFTVVDYSHTPDALRVALENAKAVCKGRIIVVFGCGGDRDKTKRPIMGKIVGDFKGVELGIITNDNPRTENAASIAKMIEEGIKNTTIPKYQIILDRKEAIHAALKAAQKDDFVLIAGKGHEDYQIIGDTKFPFDDKVVARKYLEGMKWN